MTEDVINMRSTHIWADEIPYAIREQHFQEQLSLINVWAWIINGNLVGSYPMPPQLNAQGYLNFVNNMLFQLFEDLPLETRANMWFLHDGAPCHSPCIVRH